MNKNRISFFLHDLAVLIGIGIGLAAAAFLLLFVAGWALSGFAFTAGLEVARRGLLFLGSLGLFLSAGALLVGERTSTVRNHLRWKALFRLAGLFSALFVPSVCVLVAASLLDATLFYCI